MKTLLITRSCNCGECCGGWQGKKRLRAARRGAGSRCPCPALAVPCRRERQRGPRQRGPEGIWGEDHAQLLGTPTRSPLALVATLG